MASEGPRVPNPWTGFLGEGVPAQSEQSTANVVYPSPAREAWEKEQAARTAALAAEDETRSEATETRSDSAGSGAAEGLDAYDPLAAAGEDRVVIAALLTTITGLLQGLREDIARQGAVQEQQRLVVEQQLAAVQQERRLVDELLRNGTNQGPGIAYAAQQQAQVIDTETEDASKRWPNSAWERIRAEVKKILARLFSMISKLATVKEWTVAGKVGTPGVLLGLAEASVSVTFGR